MSNEMQDVKAKEHLETEYTEMCESKAGHIIDMLAELTPTPYKQDKQQQTQKLHELQAESSTTETRDRTEDASEEYSESILQFMNNSDSLAILKKKSKEMRPLQQSEKCNDFNLQLKNVTIGKQILPKKALNVKQTRQDSKKKLKLSERY